MDCHKWWWNLTTGTVRLNLTSVAYIKRKNECLFSIFQIEKFNFIWKVGHNFPVTHKHVFVFSCLGCDLFFNLKIVIEQIFPWSFSIKRSNFLLRKTYRIGNLKNKQMKKAKTNKYMSLGERIWDLHVLYRNKLVP